MFIKKKWTNIYLNDEIYDPHFSICFITNSEMTFVPNFKYVLTFMAAKCTENTMEKIT